MAKKPASPTADVFKTIKDKNVKMVDFKFIDLPGIWQHVTVPVHRLEESSFEEGFGFDGSSIRGFKAINESDMLIVPDATTAFIDPFVDVTTISFICDIFDPLTKERFSRCARGIAHKAEQYLKSTGIADAAFMGAEAEFFIFDDVRFDTNGHNSYYYVDSIEGRWNSGRNETPNLAYKPRYKEGYYPAPPTDHQMDLRNEMVLNMMSAGLEVETQHHEVASGGQAEIDLKFEELLKHADDMMMFKYIIKTARRRHSCRSQSTAITAPACTCIRACGKMASHFFMAMAMQT